MNIKTYKKLIIIFLLGLIPAISFAELFSSEASYEVCFTPGDNCASKIIKNIHEAKNQILVQAYSFTDFSIARALVDARKKGIYVQVILDKEKAKECGRIIKLLTNNEITPFIDHQVEIAHNKVMIIDDNIVITGSYNFTYSAAKKNAENVIIIKDDGLAEKYINNWHNRKKQSVSYNN